jgi:type III pantothenate kinase
MLICIDVGNTQVYGGFYQDNNFIHSFRINTKVGWSSDQLGIFLKSFCHEHAINIEQVESIAVSSVVPSFDHHLQNACLKYFKKRALFVKAGVKSGLSVAKFKNSHEIGADLICSAVGAINLHPNTNLLIIDMGTATTICAVNKSKEFLTGLIIPGIKTQNDSLAISAEKLFSVELVKPKTIMSGSTVESIQNGIYYSHIGGIKYLLQKLGKAAFGEEKSLVIATGGYSRIFTDSGLFELFDPDLVLKGLVKIIELNKEKE